MPRLALVQLRPAAALPSLAERIGIVVRFIAVAWQVRAERRRLRGLDERALKDMGFNKGQAHVETSRSFWDVPADRLRL